MAFSVNSETNDTTHKYCIDKAIPDGSNLYYSTIFDNTKDKTIIISFHALLNELTDIIYECSDPGVARVKFKWWQEEIERLSNNEARHPVTRQMQECFSIDDDLKLSFDSTIDFFNHFIFIEQPDSLETILSLYESTIGEIWYQCANKLKPETNNSTDIIRELGAIIHFITCLQQPNIYMNETRCIIPSTYINQTDLLKLRTDDNNKHTKQKESFSPLILDLKLRLDETHRKLNKDKIIQHGLILNRIAVKTCDEILRDGCNLLDRHISLTPLRKLWIVWWTRFSIK
jgi:15-cis-phytoene synthase